MLVGFGGRIAQDCRCRAILLPDPMSMFWHAHWPWFYLMLRCYLWHTACENNIIKYRAMSCGGVPPSTPPPHHWLGCLAWAVAYIQILMLHFLTLQGNSNTVIPYRPLLNNISLLSFTICKNNGNITQKIRKWHCLPLTGGVWLWPTYDNVFHKWLHIYWSKQKILWLSQ